MTPQPPPGVGSRPSEQDIYEIAGRVAAGQADNADAATLLTALTAERAALQRVSVVELAAAEAAGERNRQEEIDALTSQVQQLEREKVELAEWVEHFYGGVIGPHGCPCYGKTLCPLHAALRSAGAVPEGKET